MKILLVEDDKSLSDTLLAFLREEGFQCETASAYDSAAEKIAIYQYDCILVDITLPGGSGLDIIRELKQHESETGILIISARDALDDKITGLDLGADDYLAKPFHLEELNARIKAIIRRRQFNGNKEVTFKNIKIIPEEKQVYVSDRLISLTKKEFDILMYFIANAKRVLSKEAIAEHIWGDHIDAADSFDFIYSQIKNLRKKLNRYSETKYIRSMYGMGYKFLND